MFKELNPVVIFSIKACNYVAVNQCGVGRFYLSEKRNAGDFRQLKRAN